MIRIPASAAARKTSFRWSPTSVKSVRSRNCSMALTNSSAPVCIRAPCYYNRFLTPQNRRILVTGGAGYIGSNTTLQLLDAGYDVVVVDNLSRGHRDAVDPARLRVVDVLDTDGLIEVMSEKPCHAVIHFAAFIAVGESMKVPEVYFKNNTAGSLSLLTAMVK